MAYYGKYYKEEFIMFKKHEVTTLDVLVMYGSFALLAYGVFHIGKILGREEVGAELNKVLEELKEGEGVE
jgi:hypothetical protein